MGQGCSKGSRKEGGRVLSEVHLVQYRYRGGGGGGSRSQEINKSLLRAFLIIILDRLRGARRQLPGTQGTHSS